LYAGFRLDPRVFHAINWNAESTRLAAMLAQEKGAKQQRYHAFVSHNVPRSLLVKELANELEKRGLSYWLDEWDLVSVIHFSRQSNWRLANATPAWRSLVRIKISAALLCFLCLVVSICSPLTSKAQGRWRNRPLCEPCQDDGAPERKERGLRRN
jgi:hypothetical protein